MIKKLQSLSNHQGFIKYFKNTSWLFGEKILRMIVGLFVGVWVARYLGPEQFGIFSYAQSFVGLFTAFATLGLDGIVIRELVKNEIKQNELLATAFWLRLISSIVVLFIIIVAVSLISNDNQTNILIFIIASAIIFQSFNVIDMYFQSKVMSKYVVYSNVITLFISSLFKIILLLNKAPLVAFAWVSFFDSAILACGLIYFFFKNSKFKFSNLKLNKLIAFNLLKDSWPLIFGSVAASIYMQIDQIMIKEIMNEESVGYYAVAVRLSEVWLFITVVLTKSYAPAIINAKKINHGLYIERLQIMYNMLVKISILISIVIVLFSKDIVLFLYGQEYTQSIEILNIYIWSTIFVFLSNGSWSYYLNENLQKIASMRLIYGAIINIILNIYFIDKFGLIGAAYSTLVSYAISSYFINYFYHETKVNFLIQTKSIINIGKIRTWIHPLTAN